MKTQTPIAKNVLKTMMSKDIRELALGWLRYEAVRKLNANRFAELCERNIRDHIQFDDLVDQLIVEDK